VTKKKIFLALLALLLIGPVNSEDLGYIAKGISFNYGDNTYGKGSFSSYNELSNELKETDYGSGTIEKEKLIRSNQAIYFDQDSYYRVLASIALSTNTSMNYAPGNMTIGTRYYVDHPLLFNSRLGNIVQVKNYASETSIAQEIERASAIRGDLKAGTITSHTYNGNYLDLGWSSMILSRKVTNGTTHIGVMHSNTHDEHPDKSAWGITDLGIDDVYSGTFILNTNLTLSWPVINRLSTDQWLPCCFGGWNNISFIDKMGFGMNNRIFDCS
jgi:hypothetical protein